MSRVARRLLVQLPINSGIRAPLSPPQSQCRRLRPFSNSSQQRASEEDPAPLSRPLTPAFKQGSSDSSPQSTQSATAAFAAMSPPSKPSSLGDLGALFGVNQAQRANAPLDPFLDTTHITSIGSNSLIREDHFEEPHHFHVYATKHNTHITLTRPNREPLLSYSAGNIGFRKAARKHYDSAFQLASYVMGRIQEQGINAQIKRLEVTFRGFGAGREAVTKALLGNEGRFLRGKVVKVSDATRLKFGGTRSKKPRRLG